MQSVVETIVQCSEELQTQRNTINILNDQVAVDNSNFSNIYDAIVAKGQTPTKSDRDTYAPAILAIDGGGSTPVLQDKTVSPSMEEQVVNADTGYDGLRNVTVEAVMLQNERVSPSTGDQYLHADEGYTGFNNVVVQGVTYTIDENIKAENIKKDVNILGVVGTLEQGSTPVLQNKTVRASQDAQYINADDGYDGLGTVTIEGVDHTVDSDIRSENIKAGVDILGVLGNYSGESVTYQSKEVDPTTSEQNISADAGYDALSNVKVKAVTAAIDGNIVASNIKKGISILNVVGEYEGPAPKVGFSTPKLIKAKMQKDYKRIQTIPTTDDRRAILFKDKIHVFKDKTHWIFDEETESLINEETVAALDGSMDWNYMPVVDDDETYMYMISYANWSGFAYLVRYDGITFERIGAQNKPLGAIFYKDGLIYVNRGQVYYTIDVADGTKSDDISKSTSTDWNAHVFKLNNKIYQINDYCKVRELDIETMTYNEVLSLSYSMFKNEIFVEKNTEWLYTTFGPLNNEKLVRFKITGEIEEIGTGYYLGTNYGGKFMCTVVHNNKIWMLWYWMEQMASLGSDKVNIVVPRDAIRLYEGCTESDVKVTNYGGMVILEIPADANYLVYDDNNIYAYNVVNDQILTAEGLKLNGNNVHGGLVNVSSYDYYIMER